MARMVATHLPFWINLVVFLSYKVSQCDSSGSWITEKTKALLPNELCPDCPVSVSFGNLTDVKRNRGEYTQGPINAITEDSYNPGTFFYASGFTLMKLSADGSVEVVLGDPDQQSSSYATGNSSSARFSLISQVVQYNETVLLVGDYLNHCVREYNSVTGLVTQLVGRCSGVNADLRPLLPGDVMSADTHFMIGVIDIKLLRRSNSLLVLDYGYLRISQYDYATDTVQLLHPSLNEIIPLPLYLLVNSDETMLYVAHDYAISSVDLQTFEVRLLVGTMAEDTGSTDIPFVAGPFDTAAIGEVETLQWLVPDQLIVTTRTKSTQALVFFDLQGEQVYSACAGGLNSSETVTGSIGVCELNSPTTLAVSHDHSILVGTLSDQEPDSYRLGSNSSIYQLHTTVSLCDFKPPTGMEVAVPNSSNFHQSEEIIVTCPIGMAVASHTKKRICGDNSKWDLPLPECIEVTPNIISISPVAGQVSGGTVVTVTGYLPDEGIQVYETEHSGSMLPILYQQVDQSLTFTMPRQNRTGTMSLTLELSPAVKVTFDYEYMDDPVAYVDRAATLSSEGVDLLFKVIDTNPSEGYELQIPEKGDEQKCIRDGDTLTCGLGSFPNVTREPSEVSVELFSYGVRITSTEVKVYPDPQFQIGVQSVPRGDPLSLKGACLNISELNYYYEINVQLSEEVTVPCLLLNVEDDVISCLPNLGTYALDYNHKTITVKVGNLQLGRGLVVFLDKESSRATGENSVSTPIVVTISALGALLILGIVMVVLCLRKMDAKSSVIKV